MKKKVGRRKFLKTGLAGSLAIGSGLIERALAREVKSSAVRSDHCELLRALVDELIPSASGMPSASTVGVVEYITTLTNQNPSIRKTLFLNLNQLQILSQTKFKASFPRLTPKQRVSVLQLMEQQQLASFSSLRDYTYEGYYTQPKVWKLMGYDFKPTNGGAPRMKPFDEAALAQVRKKPKYYREAQ